MAPKLMKMIRVEAPLLREIMAEFLGTFILVVSLHIIQQFFVYIKYIKNTRPKHLNTVLYSTHDTIAVKVFTSICAI